MSSRVSVQMLKWGQFRSLPKTKIQAAAEAKMYSNNLNGAYEYECERRKDEMRAAMESQRGRELGGKRKPGLPSPLVLVGVLAVLVAILRTL